MADYLAISQKMRQIARPDKNVGPDGTYRIRSLYFDNIYDKAVREKLDGLLSREKFRIRYYGDDTSFIRLEKKTRVNGAGYKVYSRLSAEECMRLIEGDTGWMPARQDALIMELYAKMKYQLLKPSTIVDYRREPFVYEPGNVRVTLDSDLRTGIKHTDFLNRDIPMIKTSLIQTIVLEVKYDEMLPTIIRKAVQLPGRRSMPFSKYVACRIFG